MYLYAESQSILSSVIKKAKGVRKVMKLLMRTGYSKEEARAIVRGTRKA